MVARREELQEKMKKVHEEKKILRAQSGRGGQRESCRQVLFFQGTLNSFLAHPGQLPHICDLDINSQEAEEVTSLISGLKKIKDTVYASSRAVAGQIFKIYTTWSNNLCVRDL